MQYLGLNLFFVSCSDTVLKMMTLLVLTHWGIVTHICVSQLIIIASDNGLSPDRRQAIIWSNDEILLFGPLEKDFSETLI